MTISYRRRYLACLISPMSPNLVCACDNYFQIKPNLGFITRLHSRAMHSATHCTAVAFCSSVRHPLVLCYKNSSGDEIANVNFLTTISHTRRPTSNYRKRDKPTLFNKLDDRQANVLCTVLNFSICYRISTSLLYNIPVASRGPSADVYYLTQYS